MVPRLAVGSPGRAGMFHASFPGEKGYGQSLRKDRFPENPQRHRFPWIRGPVRQGNEAYALKSPEHKAAIAVNPCNVTRGKNLSDDGSSYEVAITSSMQYPKWSSTSFDLGGVTIHVQEGLFRYLQDRGWLSYFVASYSFTNLDFFSPNCVYLLKKATLFCVYVTQKIVLR